MDSALRTLPLRSYHWLRARKRRWLGLTALILALLGYGVCLPSTLFAPQYSTVLEDRSGLLLGATIAPDGQWRFPATDSVNHRFATALIAFEDQRFWQHPGVDVRALARAMGQNLRNRRIVSGGSTLTMQVIRMSRRKPRTLWEKAIEIILATRMELRYSKAEILSLYAAHAPFGGNVVGLEAAAWRYFGRDPELLSWAELASLAVLPNAPSLVFPGRNETTFQQKRDRLLDRLYEQGTLDSLSCALAKAEPLPGTPLPLPQDAPALLTRCVQEGYAGQRIRTTLDAQLQRRVKREVNQHHDRLRGNEVYNAAALVLDVRTGATLAYVGNADMDDAALHGGRVDIIPAPRSTGSILKPFLYAGMLHEGSLLPTMLLPDIPTVMEGFAPQNFNRQFDGAVPARRALARSLNIPAVHMLRDYGIPNFHQLLKKQGLSTLTQPPMHYGLSLILGGAEGSLWDISGAYASMGRVLNQYFEYPEPNRYAPADWHSPYFQLAGTSSASPENTRRNTSLLEAGAIYLTFEAMLDVYRPDARANWQRYSSSRKIAWKTGTSYGFRDAWAVGVTPEYVVGVWAGNADGVGRPNLVGITAAGPLLFDIYNLLPGTTWFEAPRSNLIPLPVCAASGYRVSPKCPEADTLLLPPTAVRAGACTYHTEVHLDPTEQYRVHSNCQPVSEMVHTSWFVLPPAMEWYYKQRSGNYQTLPPWREDCRNGQESSVVAMEIIYPKPNAKLFIPTELDGEPGRVIVEVAHHSPNIEIHWHLDDTYLGSTTRQHSMELYPEAGMHTLTLVDGEGILVTQRFEILDKRE